MTRTGASKPVDPDHWSGRLANAKAFHRSAHEGMALAEPGGNTNPVMSDIVLAAIAYADALTAKYKRRVNQQDHSAVVAALRDALGNSLPDAQARRLRNILDDKDEVQYGVRVGRMHDAQQMLDELDAFAQWAETELRR